jgi:hypothetical protein
MVMGPDVTKESTRWSSWAGARNGRGSSLEGIAGTSPNLKPVGLGMPSMRNPTFDGATDAASVRDGIVRRSDVAEKVEYEPPCRVVFPEESSPVRADSWWHQRVSVCLRSRKVRREKDHESRTSLR